MIKLRNVLKENLSEAAGSKLVLGGLPITFNISTGPRNEITIHFYHGKPAKRVPFQAGSATLYRSTGTTNKEQLFYQEEAKLVADDIKRKLGVKDVKWVEQREFRMDYEKNKELGPTGKSIYWLTVQYPEANKLLWKLLAKEIQSK